MLFLNCKTFCFYIHFLTDTNCTKDTYAIILAEISNASYRTNLKLPPNIVISDSELAAVNSTTQS